MAEALGLAANVLGIVGVAGQIVQGISYLSDFLQGIKDAPEDVKILITELAILRPLAESVETHAKLCNRLPSGSISVQAEIEPGLKYCADMIANLEELVKSYDGKMDGRGGLMRRAGFVFASKKFDKHVGRLERSKGYLIFAQTVLISATQQPHYRLSQSIDSRIESSTRDVTSGMAQMRVGGARTNEIATQTRDIAKEILQNSRALDLILQSMPQRDELAGLEELSPLIAASIKNAVTDVLKQQQSDWDKVEARSRRKRRPVNMMADLEEGIALDTSTKTSEDRFTTFTQRTVKEDINVSFGGPNATIQYYGTRDIIKTQTTWQQVKFWFGTLHIHGSRRTVRKEDSESGDVMKSEETSQTDVKFIPASWIFGKGAIATMTWITKNYQRPVVSMSLQIFNVVAQDSQIIEACKNSDLVMIRRLFDEGKASPLDRDVDGYILTDWAIYPMIERLASWEKPWIKELRSCFGVCRFLIDTCGLDPSQSKSHNWATERTGTAWTTLLMFQIRNRGHPDGVAAAPWFERILRLLVCRAKTNPFAQAKGSLADVLELQARHLDDSIVESSFSILAGQELWSLEWDEDINSRVSFSALNPQYAWDSAAIEFIRRRMIPSTIVASEAAARQLRNPEEIQESFRKWSVMLEMVLEDKPSNADLENLLETIILAFHGFKMTRPSKDILRIFKASVRNMVLFIIQYAQKRKAMEDLKGKELSVSGLGTWKVTDAYELSQV